MSELTREVGRSHSYSSAIATVFNALTNVNLIKCLSTTFVTTHFRLLLLLIVTFKP